MFRCAFTRFSAVFLPIKISSLPTDFDFSTTLIGQGYAWDEVNVEQLIQKLTTQPRTLEGLLPKPSHAGALGVLSQDCRVCVKIDGTVSLRSPESLSEAVAPHIPLGWDQRVPVTKVVQALQDAQVLALPWAERSLRKAIRHCSSLDETVVFDTTAAAEGTIFRRRPPDPEVTALFQAKHQDSVELTYEQFQSLRNVPPLPHDHHLLYTDASKYGWGVVHVSPGREGLLTGSWPKRFLLLSQFEKELMAVVHGVLHTLGAYPEARTISVMCDNIDVVDLFGGNVSSVQPTDHQLSIRDELRQFVAKDKALLEVVWIPGRYNLADRPSRLV